MPQPILNLDAHIAPNEAAHHCPSCEVVLVANETHGAMIDGALHCTDCTHVCETCVAVSADDDFLESAFTSGYRRRAGTADVCSECRQCCNDCNYIFRIDVEGGINSSNEWVCASCYDNYTVCEVCDETILTDEAFCHRNRTLCRSCNDDREEEGADEEIIRDYDYRPTAKFFGAPYSSEELFLGWELEVDGAGEDEDNVIASGIPGHSELYVKRDGSLTRGFEVVSHPATLAHWETFTFDFVPKLRRMCYRSYETDTCGMHVHVSRSALSENDICRLLYFFRDNSELIFRLSRRKREHLIKWAAIDGSSYDSLAAKAQSWSGSRYEAINLVPHKTVEFRIFRGTLDVGSIRRNLHLVHAICKYVKTTGELTGLAFAEWLESPEGKGVFPAPIRCGLTPADLCASWIRSLL